MLNLFFFTPRLRLISLTVLAFHAFCAGINTGRAEVRVYPAPQGIDLSKDFQVTVSGQHAPVYIARVGPADETRRARAMDDYAHSDEMFDPASFTSFDFSESAVVTIQSPDEIKSAKVLPTSAMIQPTLTGKTLTFTLKHPANLTVEVNGQWCSSLHLFANPVEVNVPQPDDANVIYFGPGVHELTDGLVVGSNKTVYLAGGAILRASGAAGGPVMSLQGDHIRLCGRGVIDATACPLHSRSILVVHGNDIQIEGITLHDSPGWTLPIRQCQRVTVTNVKLFSHRANGDGIDICNSQDVTIDGCFVRTLDDCIVLKTPDGKGPERHVVVKNCVLWNQVAHALSVGAELRDPVDDVLFTDCDVIHDTGREWTLRVYHCDSALISNVRFENIRIEQSRRLISLWIGKAVWSRDEQRGQIDHVTFKNIDAVGDPATVSLQGYDTEHAVKNVVFDHVRVNGKPLSSDAVKQNSFVNAVIVEP